jgi:GTPase SAR1 family protein
MLHMRRLQIPLIRSNIKDTFLSILVAMERLEIDLENSGLESLREHVLERLSESNEFESNEFTYTNEFWDIIEELWTDTGVRRCASTSASQFNISANAQYFLDRLPVIRQKTYLPIDQDILRCRVRTDSSSDLEFSFFDKNTKFTIFDVGGQREERRKWIQHFNDVTTIIFVADISAYNMTMREDFKVNRLHESLTLFRSIWMNRWLSRVSIILFLNKYDLFTQKIESGKCKLENYFPEYRDYRVSGSLKNMFKVSNENAEVTRAKIFILEMFINIVNDKLNDNPIENKPPRYPTQLGKIKRHPAIANRTAEITRGLRKQSIVDADMFFKTDTNLLTKTESKKFCVPYFTCALDTTNIKNVFNACKLILQKEQFEKIGLL